MENAETAKAVPNTTMPESKPTTINTGSEPEVYETGLNSIVNEKQAPATSETEDGSKPDDMEHEEDVVYVTGYKLYAVMTTITAACFIMLLDTAIISTVSLKSFEPSYRANLVQAIPRITSDFHSLTDVGWYGSSYLISK
jgi:hypothetical protein